MGGESAAGGAAGEGLEVCVRNPERHGQSPAAYITYEVCTRSTSGQLSKRETTVRRRYADFVWLRAALVERCPNAFIPGLADKEKMSPTEAFDARFMERRRADLEKFIYRVAKHPALSQCKELHMFLQARVWAMETSSGLIASGSVASSNVSKMLFSLTKDADDALRRITGAGIDHSDPDHQRIQNLNAHTAKLEEQLLRIHESFKKMHKRQDGIGADCAELAPAFATLAQADGELSEAHQALAHTLEGAAKQWADQATLDELLLREPLREVVLSTQAAREVLKARDAALFSLVHAKEARAKNIKELEQAHLTLQKPKSSGALGLFRETFQLDNAQDKIDVLKAKIKESDGVIAEAEKSLKQATQSSQDEMRRFHLTSVFDTKALLVDYARSQVAFHEAMQRHWSSIIPRLEAVQTGPTRDYLPSGSSESSDNIFGEDSIETGPVRGYSPETSVDVSDSIFGEEETLLDAGKGSVGADAKVSGGADAGKGPGGTDGEAAQAAPKEGAGAGADALQGGADADAGADALQGGADALQGREGGDAEADALQEGMDADAAADAALADFEDDL